MSLLAVLDRFSRSRFVRPSTVICTRYQLNYALLCMQPLSNNYMLAVDLKIQGRRASPSPSHSQVEDGHTPKKFKGIASSTRQARRRSNSFSLDLIRKYLISPFYVRTFILQCILPGFGFYGLKVYTVSILLDHNLAESKKKTHFSVVHSTPSKPPSFWSIIAIPIRRLSCLESR